jgi:hypothetical protein
VFSINKASPNCDRKLTALLSANHFFENWGADGLKTIPGNRTIEETGLRSSHSQKLKSTPSIVFVFVVHGT